MEELNNKPKKKKPMTASEMGKLSQKLQRERLGEEGYRLQQIQKSKMRKPRAKREIKP